MTGMPDPEVPEYTGCRDVDAQWGKVCPTCHKRLPKPKPWSSDRAGDAADRPKGGKRPD